MLKYSRKSWYFKVNILIAITMTVWELWGLVLISNEEAGQNLLY